MIKKKKGKVALIGATGYTGKLIANKAREYHIDLVLMGRSVAKLKSLSDRLGYPYHACSLSNAIALQESLRGIDLVINAAGPFSATAQPVVEACLAAGAHYIDITGEIPTFKTLYSYDKQARDHDSMVMPGVGFAVVASDCLAAHVVARLPGANNLNIGVSRSDIFSRGSARTMLELFDNGVAVRRNGLIEKIPVASLEHQFDFGEGTRSALAVSWPDVFTAYYTTGVGNIAAYFEVGPMERSAAMYGRYGGWALQLPFARQFMEFQTSLLPEGPSRRSREVRSRVVVAEATNPAGQSVRSRVTTPEAYSFSALSTLEIAKRVASGEYTKGFQTPARVYGSEFLRGIPGVCIADIN